MIKYIAIMYNYKIYMLFLEDVPFRVFCSHFGVGHASGNGLTGSAVLARGGSTSSHDL